MVRDLAARLGLPFHLQVAEEWPSSGVPAAARAWRRKHALSLAASLPGPARVATAHTADDQRETLLLKLLRGVHVSRLSGMAPRAGSFVRPLLGCSKAQLVEYVGTQGVGWCEDASNEDPGYSRRNAVRLRLVPLLQQLSGGALDARLQDAVHQSAAVRGWLDAAPKAWAGAAGGAPMEEEEEEEEEAAPFLDDDREAHAARGDAPCEPGELDILRRVCCLHSPATFSVLCSHEKPLTPKRSWLRLPALVRLDQLHGFLVSSTGGAVAYATLRKLADLAAAPTARPRWRAHLSDKHTLLRCGRRLRVVARGGGGDGGPDADEGDAAAVTTTCCGDVAVTHPRSWRVRMHPLELPSSQHAGGGVAPPAGEDAWGSDALCGGQTLHLPLGGAPLLLRTRRDGDRFAPHWRPKALKLRDFLRDLKVPLHVRDTLPLLLDANRGTVLAVYPAWAAREVALPGEGRRSVRLVVQQHRVGA